MAQIDFGFLDHFLVALTRRKNLHRNEWQFGARDFIVPIIRSFARIDADVRSKIGSPYGQCQFAVDGELLLYEKFTSKIRLNPSMIAAGHRFASFFFVAERARMNFKCHGRSLTEKGTIATAIISPISLQPLHRSLPAF